MNENEIDLEREDLTVLRAVAQADRAVTTSTIREQLEWADSSRQVRYRLDKLEERGLIETRRDDSRTPSHQMAVRVSELTTAGAGVISEYDDDPSTMPVDQRLNRVEKQLVRMRDTYGAVKQRIVELENEVEEHDDDLDSIAEDVRYVREFLEEE